MESWRTPESPIQSRAGCRGQAAGIELGIPGHLPVGDRDVGPTDTRGPAVDVTPVDGAECAVLLAWAMVGFG